MQLFERHWLFQQLECHAKPLGVTACDSLTHSGQFASSSSISSSSAPLPIVSPSNSFNFGFNGCLGFFGRFFYQHTLCSKLLTGFLPTAHSMLILVNHCLPLHIHIRKPMFTFWHLVQDCTTSYNLVQGQKCQKFTRWNCRSTLVTRSV